MDTRWYPLNRDTMRDVQIVLHPTASMNEIRLGLTEGSDDSVDLTPFASQVSHTQFDASVQLNFNREFFGANQPRPNQILEFKLKQRGSFKTLWMGVIDAISSFTMSRGERFMQLSAKSRDSTEIWRGTKRLTPLFPQMTDLGYIAFRVARTAGMTVDEIALPPTGLTTPHSNTQLADMSAWEMINTVFVPCGWTPFIDNLGRLRRADRQLQGRSPDIILTDDRVVKVGAQRQRPPATRVRVNWLNPTLKKAKQQDRSLTQVVVTLGWWLPKWHKEFFFSDDHTQRAENTRINWNTSQSCNMFTKVKFCKEEYIQQGENRGKLNFKNLTPAVVTAAVGVLIATQRIPIVSSGAAAGVGVSEVTVFSHPTSRFPESAAMIALIAAMSLVGTGTYDIWGTPFEWVHARNTTEAFDESAPLWVDNFVEIDTDFIVNEPHAQAVAVRELIYQARAASKWTVTIWDDPRIEMGDIVKFPDGTMMYVEDFNRRLDRGSEATLELRGFTLSGSAGIGGTVAGGVVGPSYPPVAGEGAPGSGGGESSEGGGLSPGEPASGPGSKGEPIVPMSADGSAMEGHIKASLCYFGRKDYSYWRGLVGEPWQGGNAKWYIGWDAYMEQRAAPGDTGSAGHDLLPQPAVHQDPPPPDYPAGGWT